MGFSWRILILICGIIFGRWRRVGEAEEEAITCVHLVDVPILVSWQETEGRVDRRGCTDGDIGEVEMVEAGVSPVVGVVDESGEGVGQLLAVGGIRDEVAPGRGDALEAVDGPGGEAGEDLHDEIVREVVDRRRDCHILLPTAFLVHGSA